jgi:hypothetical protein
METLDAFKFSEHDYEPLGKKRTKRSSGTVLRILKNHNTQTLNEENSNPKGKKRQTKVCTPQNVKKVKKLSQSDNHPVKSQRKRLYLSSFSLLII